MAKSKEPDAQIHGDITPIRRFRPLRHKRQPPSTEHLFRAFLLTLVHSRLTSHGEQQLFYQKLVRMRPPRSLFEGPWSTLILVDFRKRKLQRRDGFLVVVCTFVFRNVILLVRMKTVTVVFSMHTLFSTCSTHHAYLCRRICTCTHQVRVCVP